MYRCVTCLGGGDGERGVAPDPPDAHPLVAPAPTGAQPLAAPEQHE